MAWDDLATTYTVRKARIVVAIHDGGAVVETGDVDYIEGRFAIAMNDGDEPSRPPFLHREMTFHRHGRLEPLSVAMTKARIVIDGTTDDGPLEIRGDGYFGYDEHGQIEGSFSEPPMMLLDKLEFPENGSRGARGKRVGRHRAGGACGVPARLPARRGASGRRRLNFHSVRTAVAKRDGNPVQSAVDGRSRPSQPTTSDEPLNV